MEESKRLSRWEWEEILKRYEATELTQSKFCEVEGIKLTTFQKWREKLRKPRLVELKSKVELEPTWRYELELPCGALLRGN